MGVKTAHLVLRSAAAALSLLIPLPSQAQVQGASLAGTITSSAGKPVPNAKVSLKNPATARSAETQTNSAGLYSFSRLEPGDYEISVSATGFDPKTANVTLAAGAQQTLDLELTSALSLQSLGFPTAVTQGSAAQQALLDKRSHMLQIHQKLGLITTFPLIAAVVSSTQAGRRASDSTRDLHVALGSATAGLYFASAYYAIFAPKVEGVKARGPIRLHKAMAWIHGPGMILTPVLGEMAFAQINNGERVHGIAKYHSEVAIVTAAAYGIALISVTRPHFFSRAGHDARALLGFHHPSASESAAGDAGDAGKSKGRSGNGR